MRQAITHRALISERGAATVEFAVIATLLLLVLFGIIEFGLTFFQKHFVSNAAREGLRTGVVADNFNCFNDGPPAIQALGCGPEIDRWDAVDLAVRDYLGALYAPADILLVDIRSPESVNNVTRKPLTVSVRVRNFMPSIIVGLVPGYTHPETITFTVTGDYEDPQEP